MALSINTNIGALGASAAASAVNKTMETSMERLSSGLRINTAADDAAGMAIASRMDAQIRGLNQAIRNAADGQSLVDTTEGAHIEIENILQRMRELAVQSANDTNVSSDRTSLQAEITQLIAEIDRIGVQTTWNGVAVLDGTFTSKQLQIGADAGQTMTFSVDSAKSASIGTYKVAGTSYVGDSQDIAGNDLTISGYVGTAVIGVDAGNSAKDVAAAVNAQTTSTGVTANAVTKMRLSGLANDSQVVAFTLTGDAATSISVSIDSKSDLTALRDAINAKAGVTGISAAFGSTKAVLDLTHGGGEDIVITSFATTTDDTDFIVTALDATGTATADTHTLNENGATTTAYAVGNLDFHSVKTFTVSGDGTTAEQGFLSTNASVTATLSAVSSINIGTASGSATAIRILDGAINKINTARGDLGAISNRLDNTISNLTNISTNISSSQSRIQDADFAAESTNLAKSQILQQAATAMLAQANAAKQGVLQLLQG